MGWWSEVLSGALTGDAVAVVGLGVGIPLVAAALWRLGFVVAGLGELELPTRLLQLHKLLGSVKLPDKLLLARGGVWDLPESFWDDFNFLYAELERCPESEPLRFDFWDWNRKVKLAALELRPEEKSVLFDISLVLPFSRLYALDLSRAAMWRMEEDPRYDTVLPQPPTERLLPKDRAQIKDQAPPKAQSTAETNKSKAVSKARSKAQSLRTKTKTTTKAQSKVGSKDETSRISLAPSRKATDGPAAADSAPKPAAVKANDSAKPSAELEMPGTGKPSTEKVPTTKDGGTRLNSRVSTGQDAELSTGREPMSTATADDADLLLSNLPAPLPKAPN